MRWKVALAVAGWVMLCGLTTPQPGRGEAKPLNAQERMAEAQERIAGKLEGPEPLKAVETACTGRDNEDQKSELCAYWVQAHAAERSAFWAWISGIGVIGALIMTAWSNRIASASARREQRAYVGDSDTRLENVTVDGNKFLRLEMEWKNFGKTPALNLISKVDWVEFPSEIPNNFDFPHKDVAEDEIPMSVFPDRYVYCFDKVFVPYSIYQRIRDHETRFFVYASVEYDDVFGKRRRTEVAGELTFIAEHGEEGTFGFQSVNRYNGVDGSCLKRPQGRKMWPPHR